MDKFAENLAGGIRRFAMAGVGAVSLTIDKSKEIIDSLVARGEVTAAEGQVACDEMQKKLAAQLDAFSKKLKDDYENSSFEQLMARCEKLTPEQKARLIERLSAEPADEASAGEETGDACDCTLEDEPECACAPEEESACECAETEADCASAESAEQPVCAEADKDAAAGE